MEYFSQIRVFTASDSRPAHWPQPLRLGPVHFETRFQFLD
jgi:hypothetical protein